MEWQDVASHHGKYEVSRAGCVRRANGRDLNPWLNSQGYAVVRLSAPRVMVRVHRLVAQAFIPNPDGLPYVNHIDSNRANNLVENLEWCTQWQNLYHARKAGMMPNDFWKGKRSPRATLSDETVSAVRDAYASGGGSWEKLGKDFGISKRTIGRILSGESYM